MKDDTEITSWAGNWYMEILHGAVTAIVTKPGWENEGTLTKEIRYSPADIAYMEVPITGWQTVGNIIIGTIIAIPSIILFYIIFSTVVLAFSF
jgi:hypothetical protein